MLLVLLYYIQGKYGMLKKSDLNHRFAFHFARGVLPCKERRKNSISSSSSSRNVGHT